VDSLSDTSTSIYALCEPSFVAIDGQLPPPDVVRYVGKSVNPRRRFAEHRQGRKSIETPCARWIRKLRRANQSPVMVLIDTVAANQDWEAIESHWILEYREQGAHLLNLLGGGQGWHNPPQALRDRISVISKQRWAEPGFRERQRAASAIAMAAPEYRSKHAAIQRARMQDEALRSRIIAGVRRSWADPEKRAARLASIKAAKEQMPEQTRRDLHTKLREHLTSAEQQQRVKAGIESLWSDPERRAARLDAMRQSWATRTPDQRAAHANAVSEARRRKKAVKVCAICAWLLSNSASHGVAMATYLFGCQLGLTLSRRSAEEVSAARSAMLRQRWSDPSYKGRVLNSIRANGATPEFRAKMADVNMAAWSDPERRAARNARRLETMIERGHINPRAVDSGEPNT
jgi:hypothetical protein